MHRYGYHVTLCRVAPPRIPPNRQSLARSKHRLLNRQVMWQYYFGTYSKRRLSHRMNQIQVGCINHRGRRCSCLVSWAKVTEQAAHVAVVI